MAVEISGQRILAGLNVLVDIAGVLGQAMVSAAVTLAIFAGSAESSLQAGEISGEWAWKFVYAGGALVLLNAIVVLLSKSTGRRLVAAVSYYVSLIMLAALALDQRPGSTPLDDFVVSTAGTVGAVILVSLFYAFLKCRKIVRKHRGQASQSTNGA